MFQEPPHNKILHDLKPDGTRLTEAESRHLDAAIYRDPNPEIRRLREQALDRTDDSDPMRQNYLRDSGKIQVGSSSKYRSNYAKVFNHD